MHACVFSVVFDLLSPHCQAPLSTGFPRQEHWSGLPFPPPRDLPGLGIKLCLLYCQVHFLPLAPPGMHLDHPVELLIFSGYLPCPLSGGFPLVNLFFIILGLTRELRMVEGKLFFLPYKRRDFKGVWGNLEGRSSFILIGMTFHWYIDVWVFQIVHFNMYSSLYDNKSSF